MALEKCVKQIGAPFLVFRKLHYSKTVMLVFVFQSLSKLLGLSEAEVEHVISQVDRCQQVSATRKHPAARVRFGGDSETHVSVFLECFTCNLHVSEQDSQAGVCAISLVKDLSDDKKLQLGKSLNDELKASFEPCSLVVYRSA